MKKLFLMVIAATLLSACASRPDPTTQGMLDFGSPPNQFSVARLVAIDGNNIASAQTRFTHWVDPGEHELLISAALDTTTNVRTVNRPANRGQGRTTIVVEAGKRYRIAAQATNRTGGWEPVVWAIEDL
jgi:hypothetical protein